MKSTKPVLFFTLLLAGCLQVNPAYAGSLSFHNVGNSVQLLNFLLLWRSVCGAEHPHIYLRLNCATCRGFFHANNARKFCDNCLRNLYDNKTERKSSLLVLLPGDKSKIRKWDRDCLDREEGNKASDDKQTTG